jgi:hypothetical protein
MQQRYGNEKEIVPEAGRIGIKRDEKVRFRDESYWSGIKCTLHPEPPSTGKTL